MPLSRMNGTASSLTMTKRFFGVKRRQASGRGTGTSAVPGKIPDDPGNSPANDHFFHPVRVGHLVEQGNLAVRNERGAEMVLINPVDQINIFRKCRACIAGGSDRNFTGLCATGTGPGENRCMADITPAEQDFAKIGRAHLVYLLELRE